MGVDKPEKLCFSEEANTKMSSAGVFRRVAEVMVSALEAHERCALLRTTVSKYAVGYRNNKIVAHTTFTEKNAAPPIILFPISLLNVYRSVEEVKTIVQFF